MPRSGSRSCPWMSGWQDCSAPWLDLDGAMVEMPLEPREDGPCNHGPADMVLQVSHHTCSFMRSGRTDARSVEARQEGTGQAEVTRDRATKRAL